VATKEGRPDNIELERGEEMYEEAEVVVDQNVKKVKEKKKKERIIKNNRKKYLEEEENEKFCGKDLNILEDNNENEIRVIGSVKNAKKNKKNRDAKEKKERREVIFIEDDEGYVQEDKKQIKTVEEDSCRSESMLEEGELHHNVSGNLVEKKEGNDCVGNDEPVMKETSFPLQKLGIFAQDVPLIVDLENKKQNKQTIHKHYHVTKKHSELSSKSFEYDNYILPKLISFSPKLDKTLRNEIQFSSSASLPTLIIPSSTSPTISLPLPSSSHSPSPSRSLTSPSNLLFTPFKNLSSPNIKSPAISSLKALKFHIPKFRRQHSKYPAVADRYGFMYPAKLTNQDTQSVSKDNHIYSQNIYVLPSLSHHGGYNVISTSSSSLSISSVLPSTSSNRHSNHAFVSSRHSASDHSSSSSSSSSLSHSSSNHQSSSHSLSHPHSSSRSSHIRTSRQTSNLFIPPYTFIHGYADGGPHPQIPHVYRRHPQLSNNRWKMGNSGHSHGSSSK
jgi:hypothetical protein